MIMNSFILSHAHSIIALPLYAIFFSFFFFPFLVTCQFPPTSQLQPSHNSYRQGGRRLSHAFSERREASSWLTAEGEYAVLCTQKWRPISLPCTAIWTQDLLMIRRTLSCTASPLGDFSVHCYYHHPWLWHVSVRSVLSRDALHWLPSERCWFSATGMRCFSRRAANHATLMWAICTTAPLRH